MTTEMSLSLARCPPVCELTDGLRALERRVLELSNWLMVELILVAPVVDLVVVQASGLN